MFSWRVVLFFIVCTAIFPSSQCSIVPSPQTNPSNLQKAFGLFGGGGNKQAAAALQSPQYSGFIQLLTQIPTQSFTKIIDQFTQGLVTKRSKDLNLSQKFENWARTVNTSFSKILYPSQFSPVSGKQISSIQQFVKKASKQGKRVRGAGARHSWSNIFSDPQEYLVSLYPKAVTDATSQAFDVYFREMIKLQEQMATINQEHLNLIRKVGEITVEIKQEGKVVKNQTKHLVKIGATVSNKEVSKWAIKNGYQIKSNAIISELTFIGALCTCSHGSGIKTQTLCDYIYQIEFIDHNGNRQKISKREHPKLIKSAAGSLGLLGIVIFVTVEMQDLQIVRLLPKIDYKDFVIPWPKDYPIQKQKLRLQRPQYKAWLQNKNSSNINQEYCWKNNMQRFKQTVNGDYIQWFYFPEEGTNIVQNFWSVYSKKTAQNIAKIKSQDPQSIFVDSYPTELQGSFAQFSLFLASQLAGNQATLPYYNALVKSPFAFLPKSNMYINYPDAIHFQAGFQNFVFRDFECQINIPTINVNGKLELDYDLIQRIWWAGVEIVDRQPIVNFNLELRIFKGSDSPLAPSYGFEYVCSIELLRSRLLDASSLGVWNSVLQQAFNAWRSLTDSLGNKVVIRPHWGKEWEGSPKFKSYISQDNELRKNIRKFLADYKEIAKLKNFSYEKNLYTFSSKFFREFLNNAIQNGEDKIK